MDLSLDDDDIKLLNMLSDRQKAHALASYRTRAKKTSIAYLLWFFFGVYYFYLGHPAKNIILWVLCFFCVGFIWWFVDLFRLSGMVRRKNKEILASCIKEALKLYPDDPLPGEDEEDEDL